MDSYPIFMLSLAGHRVVVVGGGRVAARKVESLLASGWNCITVISPHLSPDLADLVEKGVVEQKARHYQTGDLEGATLALAATDNLQVNREVWEEAKQRSIPVNVSDDPQRCTFIVPAVIRRGDLTVAISSGGGSPAFARWLRHKLEDWLDADYGEILDVLAELRPQLVESCPDSGERSKRVFDLLDGEILDILKCDGRVAAKAYILKRFGL